MKAGHPLRPSEPTCLSQLATCMSPGTSTNFGVRQSLLGIVRERLGAEHSVVFHQPRSRKSIDEFMVLCAVYSIHMPDNDE